MHSILTMHTKCYLACQAVRIYLPAMIAKRCPMSARRPETFEISDKRSFTKGYPHIQYRITFMNSVEK